MKNKNSLSLRKELIHSLERHRKVNIRQHDQYKPKNKRESVLWSPEKGHIGQSRAFRKGFL